jgi:hypothetical protein
MNKTLFIAVMLLAPSLAYSADLTVQVVPAASSPAVPAAAQAAGFTTLAANWDFSQATYATQSNWLDCNDNNSSLAWHAGVPGVTSIACNIFQTVDPNTGQTVMHFLQLPSYGAGKFMGMQTKVGSTITFGVNNYFVEATYRIGSSCTAPSNTCGPSGVWTWNDDTQGGHIEWDFMEEYGDQGGFSDGSPHWFSYSTNNLPAGYSVFNYHKVSNLITSDGSSSKLDCGYVDDRLQGCGAAADTNSSIYNTKFWMIASTQSGADGQTGNGNIDMYLQYIRVWTCANYQNNPCNGSAQFSGSQDGQPLTYWH